MSYNIIDKYNNVWDMFSKSCEKYENKKFFHFKRGFASVDITYGEELTKVKKVAKYLVDLGIKKGDKVVLYIPTSPTWIDVFYACSLLGAIVIPIDMETPEEVIERIISDNNPKVIFEESSKTIKSHNNIHREDAEKFETKIIDLEPIKVRDYIKEINENDLVEIMYTSGTTGRPKGVQITNKSIVSNVYNVLLIFPVKPILNLMQLLPLSHIYAQILTFGITVLGGQIFFLERVTGEAIKSTLKENFINTLPVVPQVLMVIKDGIENKFRRFKMLPLLNLLQKIASMIKITWFRRKLFFFIHKELGGNLELIASAGAPLPPDVFKWWENLGIEVYKGYGATETGPVITFEDKENPDPFSVGKPIPNQMFKIDDNGEILTKGDHVTIGYYKNDEANKDAFTEDGWYRTGDKGYMENGLVYLQGRIKDMIVLSNGINVFPNDVEIEFNKIHGIEDTVVLGIDFGRGNELTAVFKTEFDKDTIEKIVYKTNNKLTKNQWIKHFLIWEEDDFPRTHTKKVKRNIVKDKVKKILFEGMEQKKKTAQTISLEDSLESEIKQILSDIVEKDYMDIKESANLSSELGIDSLGRADLVAQIADKLGKDLDETNIDASTTVRDLIQITKASPEYKGLRKINVSTIIVHPLLVFLREAIFLPLARIAMFFLLDTKINGKFERSDKPRLIISNHRSNLDGIVAYLSLPKDIRTKTVLLMAGDIWDRKKYFLGKKIVETFLPVYSIDRRYNATVALTVTAKFLNNGYNVLIFPEGKISYDYKENGIKFKKGTATIAKDFRSPITELKIKGLEIMPEGAWLPPKLRTPVIIDVDNTKVRGDESVDEINEKLQNDFRGY